MDDKPNINEALNKLNSGEMNKKFEEFQNNDQLMEKLATEVANNPQLADMAPKLADDPRVNQFLQDNPDVNRKQALQMKKQMNKAAHAKRMKMEKINGCLINPGRKLKSVTIVLEKGELSEKEIKGHLCAKMVTRMETNDFLVYYDGGSGIKNKRVTKAFDNSITGGTVIILSKEGDLSVEEFEKWEKKPKQKL